MTATYTSSLHSSDAESHRLIQPHDPLYESEKKRLIR